MRAESGEPIDIDDPVVLIRIPATYRPGMADQELFEATSGYWKVGPRRKRARYALAVVDGAVVEVYQINYWQPAGTAASERSPSLKDHDRWEFVGRTANDAIREKYRGGSVKHYFKRGNQSPVRYVNC